MKAALLLVVLGIVVGASLIDARKCAGGRVFVEHEERQSAPQGWIQRQRLASDQSIELLIAIHLRNTADLERRFWAVSDPASPEYGRFLTPVQVAELVSPSLESHKSVLEWLAAHGVNKYEWNSGRDFLRVYTTVDLAESLLGGIQFHAFESISTSSLLFRSLEAYSVPESVASHIDFIGGVNHFPRNAPRVTSTTVRTMAEGVNPNVIKKVFNITASPSNRAANNSLSVAQFLEQYYSPSDLELFQNTYGLPKRWPERVVGKNEPSNPGTEAQLDIEYAMGVAIDIPTWFVSTSGRHESQEPFLEWIQYVNDHSAPRPLVNSVSYGDVESSITLAYAKRVDQEFQKAGVSGKSILFASGDDGVGCNWYGTQFEPNWPATSSYVTAVGGVVLTSTSPLLIQSDGISSGGFSNYFLQPTYQKAAVAAYLAQGNLPTSSYYNTTGRAFPDVAAFSESVEIVIGGGLTFVGGTSCAAPVWSAVVALLNDERMQQGKSPLGFLNTQLYTIAQKYPSALMDITSGTDNGNGVMCSPGFKPAQGWDPVTGLGVPNYNQLSRAFASL